MKQVHPENLQILGSTVKKFSFRGGLTPSDLRAPGQCNRFLSHPPSTISHNNYIIPTRLLISRRIITEISAFKKPLSNDILIFRKSLANL